jgi:hypothetical protein
MSSARARRWKSAIFRALSRCSVAAAASASANAARVASASFAASSDAAAGLAAGFVDPTGLAGSAALDEPAAMSLRNSARPSSSTALVTGPFALLSLGWSEPDTLNRCSSLSFSISDVSRSSPMISPHLAMIDSAKTDTFVSTPMLFKRILRHGGHPHAPLTAGVPTHFLRCILREASTCSPTESKASTSWTYVTTSVLFAASTARGTVTQNEPTVSSGDRPPLQACHSHHPKSRGRS